MNVVNGMNALVARLWRAEQGRPNYVKLDSKQAAQLSELAWSAVSSSNLERIAFEAVPEQAIKRRRGGAIRVGWLFVAFRSGGVYAYSSVPEPIAALLHEAASPGRAHSRLVADRGYRCFKLELP